MLLLSSWVALDDGVDGKQFSSDSLETQNDQFVVASIGTFAITARDKASEGERWEQQRRKQQTWCLLMNGRMLFLTVRLCH